MNTADQYLSLDKAYQYFNDHLFDKQLPACLITFQRRKCYGYFSANRFSDSAGATTDEIALNPDHFEKGDKGVLGTLVHEMCHLWQQHFGKPGRGNYHNREFAKKMEDLGLMTSRTGKPDGKRTGEPMSHYIIEAGRFDTLATEMLQSEGHIIRWKSQKRVNGRKSKTKYSCPMCHQNAWAKPGARLVCGGCMVGMEART